MQLPGSLVKQFNTYCVQLMNHRGIINDVKPKLMRKALEEFLTKHAEDFDIKL